MIKCIKVLLSLTLLILHSGTQLLFSQSISTVNSQSISRNSLQADSPINSYSSSRENLQAGSLENSQSNSRNSLQSDSQINSYLISRENLQAGSLENSQSISPQNLKTISPENSQAFSPQNLSTISPENSLAFSLVYSPPDFPGNSQTISLENSQSDSPVTSDFNSDRQINKLSGINKGKVLVSNEETTAMDKSNLIPVRKKFQFSLIGLLRGLLGMGVLIFLTFLLSEKRRAVPWKVVGLGLLLQILLAIGILQVPFIQSVFEFGGKAFVKILDFTNEGTEFLFKSMVTGKIEAPLQTFAIRILPTIIFFSAITSVLFYFGVIQKIVWLLAWLMSRFLKISGAESLSVAGNIFLGMSEAPLMIKAYLEKMSRSEIMLVMSGGMATMAGGVLAVYINFLGGDDPAQKLEFAKHLLAASVMAAPGIVVVSKMMIPQTEPVSREVVVDQKRVGKNVLDAISIGTVDGLKLAVNVAAMLLVFLAFLAMLNYIFLNIGNWMQLNTWIAEISDGRYDHLSLQFLLGYALSPLMWLLGVASEDITIVGTLLGEKLIMTEFVGYISLAQYKAAGIFSNPKSIIMATYILCGFANFASVGIQIGAIGALAPTQRVLLSKLGMKALIAGTLASLLSATIVGVILG